MKQLLTLLFLIVIYVGPFAQNTQKADSHSSNQNLSNRNDGKQIGWMKIDNDDSNSSYTPATGNENVSYYSTSDGIFVTIISGSNKIKLYALTGQLLSNGDLSQGHFFTSTRRGIYLLKINNRTYKLVCK